MFVLTYLTLQRLIDNNLKERALMCKHFLTLVILLCCSDGSGPILFLSQNKCKYSMFNDPCPLMSSCKNLQGCDFFFPLLNYQPLKDVKDHEKSFGGMHFQSPSCQSASVWGTNAALMLLWVCSKTSCYVANKQHACFSFLQHSPKLDNASLKMKPIRQSTLNHSR